MGGQVALLVGGFIAGLIVGPFLWKALARWFFGADGGY